MPRLDIGEYEFEYDAATDDITITQVSSGESIVIDGEELIVSGVAADTLTLSAKQAEPTPANNLVYLDDGTNTADGQPGFRYFDGANWIDL